MAQTAINNGDAGSDVRAALNSMFTQVFGGKHPGRVAGRWYHAAAAPIVSGGSFATGSARLLPFLLDETITISDLGARIVTAAASGNFQLAIYASDPATKLPTGNALAATGNISTTSTGAVSGDIAGADVQLAPGFYWMAVSVDATASAAAAFMSILGTVPWATHLIGSATHANIIPASAAVSLHLSAAVTHGTWPDLTSASFTETTNSQAACAVQYKVASVP